jgi:hypothetical protein
MNWISKNDSESTTASETTSRPIRLARKSSQVCCLRTAVMVASAIVPALPPS